MGKRSRRGFSTLGWSASLLVSAMMLPVDSLVAHESPAHEAGSMSGNAQEHQHEMLEIPAEQTAPTVNLVLHSDPMRGWNLEVQTTNFRFAPEEIGMAEGGADRKAASTAGETIPGHAHLYIDGKKITRLYSNWYYISELTPGSHQIRVSLSTNQHEELMYNGQSIAATLEVNIPPESPTSLTPTHPSTHSPIPSSTHSPASENPHSP